MSGAGAGKGRVAIKDIVDATAERDPEYQKVVKEITEGQNKSGWLVQRGAYDRTDLQYIADFKESERQQEMDLRDIETNEFAALRNKMDDEGLAAGSGLRVAVKDKKEIKPAAKLLPVKIVSPREGPAAGAPPLKRTRTGSPPAAEHAAPAAPALAAEDDVDNLPVPHGRAVYPEDSTQAQAGLQGLLGPYDSGSDSESVEMGAGKKDKGGQGPSKPAVALPSAAELLGVDEVSAPQPVRGASEEVSESESGGST